MQHTLDYYIGNLLYFHECVVVPGFGAFLTRSYAAEINPATHMLRPPSKRVVFNSRIQDNDGLLAQHIARVEGKSYRSAIDGIEIAARSWKKSLRAGRKVNLSGIGRLFIDDKGKLQFNPAHDVNYDIHSYGLNIFRANAMEREQEIKRNVNKAIEKHQSQKGNGVKITPAKVKDTASKISWVRWTATLGPVAALLIVGAYFYNQNPDSINELGGKISSAFINDSQGLQDNSLPQESNESSIGFGAAERLNKNFGPEDDVLSEQENTADIEKDTKPEIEPLVSPKEEVEEEENADNTSQKTLNNFAKTQDFEIHQKPLYNVKRRPREETDPGNINQNQSSDPASPSAWTPNLSVSTSQKFLPKAEPVTKKEESKVSEVSAEKVTAAPAKKVEKTALKSSSAKAVQAETDLGNMQIIVGAFSNVQNAERYTSNLQAKGWDAYIYKSGSFNRVAIGKLNNREKAQLLLTKVKKEVNYQAWLNIQ